MDSFDVTREQAIAIRKELKHACKYLLALQVHIQSMNFPSNDELKLQVDSAVSSLSDLDSLLFRIEVGSGMGRLPQRWVKVCRVDGKNG